MLGATPIKLPKAILACRANSYLGVPPSSSWLCLQRKGSTCAKVWAAFDRFSTVLATNVLPSICISIFLSPVLFESFRGFLSSVLWRRKIMGVWGWRRQRQRPFQVPIQVTWGWVRAQGHPGAPRKEERRMQMLMGTYSWSAELCEPPISHVSKYSSQPLTASPDLRI